MLGWLLNLGFAGSEAAVVASTQEGLDYALADDRGEYNLGGRRAEYSLPIGRAECELTDEH